MVNLRYLKNVTSNPQFITSGDAYRRSYLELPLARHNLAIDTTNVNASIKTSLVMSVDNITSKSLVSTNTTIVWSLNLKNVELN